MPSDATGVAVLNDLDKLEHESQRDSTNGIRGGRDSRDLSHLLVNTKLHLILYETCLFN